jgi:hypothetical protein
VCALVHAWSLLNTALTVLRRSNNPMFQAACALSIMITAYSLHTWASPFLTISSLRKRPALQKRITNAARARSLWAATAVDAVLTSSRRQLMDLNALEATMLRAAIAVLLGGMMVCVRPV